MFRKARRVLWRGTWVGVFLFGTFVAVSPTSAAVCTVGGSSPTHASLEAALADATCDPIQLAPGAYTTAAAQVVINRDVTIVGMGSSPTDVVISPTQNTGGSGNARAWFWITGGATVNWQNVTFDASGHNVLTVLNYGDVSNPAGARGYGTISNVVVRNVRYNTYVGIGIGVYHGSSITVRSVTMYNIWRIGVHVRGSSGTGAYATIDGLHYTGKGSMDGLDYGVEFGGGGQGTVINSHITNCTAVASVDGSTSAAVLITTYFGPGTTATVTNSVLADNTDGVVVGYDAADTSTATVQNNCIVNNSGLGVRSTAPPVAAINNWWGTPSGPTVGGTNGVSANVTYTPFLTAPASACAGYVPGAADNARAQAPLCADLTGTTNEIVRADVPDGTVTNGGVFCRVLAQDGDFVRSPAEIGNADVLAMDVVQAVDVFGMAGTQSVPQWNSGVKVCLRGSGRLFFLDALSAPRALQPLSAHTEGEYTCGQLLNAGTVVLVQ